MFMSRERLEKGLAFEKAAEVERLRPAGLKEIGDEIIVADINKILAIPTQVKWNSTYPFTSDEY